MAVYTIGLATKNCREPFHWIGFLNAPAPFCKRIGAVFFLKWGCAMENERDIIKELETAKNLAFQALEIVYEIKYIEGYIPTNKEYQMFVSLTSSLKINYECVSYITSCMQRRMHGQHEYDYIKQLFKDLNRNG